MTPEDYIRRFIEENQQARQKVNNQMSRLLDVLTTGDSDEYSKVTTELLSELTTSPEKDSGILGEDGTPESSDGGTGSQADEMGTGAAT